MNGIAYCNLVPKNVEYESYRFINALLVKKYTENNIEYSVNGEKPSDGYFT